MRKITLAAAAAFAVASTAAFATVTFDPATGTGFVGKGDVQLAFGGKNDAWLQNNAGSLGFTYHVEETYRFDCTFTMVIGRDKVPTPQTETRGRDFAVSDTVAYDSRKNSNNKVTGFNLTGATPTGSTGDAPQEGGSCPGGPLNDGTISNVQLVSSTGGLFVNLGAESHQIL
jgi:opacity protein-like surface antigen